MKYHEYKKPKEKTVQEYKQAKEKAKQTIIYLKTTPLHYNMHALFECMQKLEK